VIFFTPRKFSSTGSSPSEITEIFGITPWKFKKQFDPFRNFPFPTPLGNISTSDPSQIQKISDPSENLVNRGVCILNGMAL
jgi:hypothetical protein